MKKAFLYIIGFTAGLIALAYLFSFLPIDIELAAGLILIIFITSLIATLWLNAKIQDKQREKIIPENVGVHSYIDNSNGVIYLYSYDYKTRNGSKWIATSKAVTINLNWDSSVYTIPFSAIKVVNLQQGSPASRIILTINETYQYCPVDGSGAYGTKTKIRAVDFDIYFHTYDLSIAKEIQNRVAIG